MSKSKDPSQGTTTGDVAGSSLAASTDTVPPLEQRTDTELGRLFGRGTKSVAGEALSKLLHRHDSQLRTDALRLCGGNQADADDLFSVFSMHLLEKHDKFNPDLGMWIVWSRAVLRRCASGERRKKNTRERNVQADDYVIELAVSSQPPPWFETLQDEIGKAVNACLKELEDELQLVVFLRLNYTLEQTTRMLNLGTGPGPARSRSDKAIKQLKSCLKGKGFGPEDVA